MNLPESLELEMRQQESNPNDIPAARKVLERALIWQFREIARGLLAHELLRRGKLSDEHWLQQFLAMEDDSAARKAAQDATVKRFFEAASVLAHGISGREEPPAETKVQGEGAAQPHSEADFDLTRNPTFQSFRQSFYVDVAQRCILRLSPADLGKHTLRIYGGPVCFWCEGRINRQLADLGSSLRLFVLGSNLMRLRAIGNLLGESLNGPNVGIFILGEVRPCTFFGKAVLFEFVTEYAVSPLLDPLSPGLTDECRVVLRSKVAAMPWFLRWSFPLTHELRHVVQSYPPGAPGSFSSWKAIFREDICRFAQIPRTREEIHEAFVWTSFSADPLFEDMLPPGESPESLSTILEGLCNDGLLQLVTGDRYYCDRFSEAKVWPLI